MRSPLLPALLCVLLLLCPQAEAARALPWKNDQSKTALLAEVESYLNALSTVQADFVQITPQGSIASGTFFLKRPGKMRWQYDPPTPILMVATGDYLIYHDYELEQVSHIPLDDTLAGFLARKNIRFDPEIVTILDVSQTDGVIRVRLTQAEKPDEGELTLELSARPMQLRNLIVRDVQGQETNVSLSNARFGLQLPPALFTFKGPEKPAYPSHRR